jgi:hypothetical protein
VALIISDFVLQAQVQFLTARGQGLFTLFSRRCIYHELDKAAPFFERLTYDELQEVRKIHLLQNTGG